MIHSTNLCADTFGTVYRKNTNDSDPDALVGHFSRSGLFHQSCDTDGDQPGINPHELQEIAYLAEAHAEHCASVMKANGTTEAKLKEQTAFLREPTPNGQLFTSDTDEKALQLKLVPMHVRMNAWRGHIINAGFTGSLDDYMQERLGNLVALALQKEKEDERKAKQVIYCDNCKQTGSLYGNVNVDWDQDINGMPSVDFDPSVELEVVGCRNCDKAYPTAYKADPPNPPR